MKQRGTDRSLAIQQACSALATEGVQAAEAIIQRDYPFEFMQERHRIARPGARAVFYLPYGSSDDAYSDPTHVRPYFLESLSFFGQPAYWRADYGYRGDWRIVQVVLAVRADRVQGLSSDAMTLAIHTRRNIVQEMMVEFEAVKPVRAQRRELAEKQVKVSITRV